MERLFVECAVRAALIAVVTAVVLRTIGITTAAARHTAWTSVMLTMLLLPIWTEWGPKVPIRVLPPVAQSETMEAPLTDVLPYSASRTEMYRIETSGSHRAVQHWNWQSLLLVVYGFGAFGLLARLAIGTARTHRLISRTNVRDGKRINSGCASPWTLRVPCHAPDLGWALWEWRCLEAFFGSVSGRFSTPAEHCESPVQRLWLQ